MLGVKIYFDDVLAFLSRRLFSFLFPLVLPNPPGIVVKLVALQGVQEIVIAHILPIRFKAVVDMDLAIWWERVVSCASNVLIRNLEGFPLRSSGGLAFLRGRWW